MDSFALIFVEVVIERLDKMKEIIEHATPLQAGEFSMFAFYSPSTEPNSHIPIRRRSIKGRPYWSRF
jgi:hypothetical protein